MSGKIILNSLQIDILLNRLICQLIEKHQNFNNTVLIGLQPRGVFLLDRLLFLLKNKYNIKNILSGKLDITFFRDDFRRSDKPLKPNFSLIDISVEGKSVIFIDDVLYTGRSIRAALSAIETYGRPIEIELLILIDRRFSRHLPIQPDYIGRQVDALKNDKVKVNWIENDNEDSIYLIRGNEGK
ncbi:MAG: bifunctional pyr operon transcriptional regulator/uracil phosphoribosyltransferase PyrR [Flavobacteriaceae bacterium]|nr:bifunctional pyr operon transcriptional regulator/uracil phosphoribosyltransferase PyrR [Flavobacteriaceae bacterium]